MKRMIALLLVVLLCLSLTACGSEPDGKYSCKIRYKTIEFIFDDGEAVLTDGSESYIGTYSMEGDTVYVTMSRLGYSQTIEMTYDADADTLYVVEDDITFTKD